MAHAAGIDVGGTKIEARLFAPDWQVLASRRTVAPNDSYENLLAATADQYRWLRAQAGGADVPVGVGFPGFIDHASGHMVVANLPVAGRNLGDDLTRIIGHDVPFVNDVRAFALSEATLGAGRGFRSVYGLVIGTGLAGGLAINGKIQHGRNGAAGEVGHTPLAAPMMAKYDLPGVICGCGRLGCQETYVSGTGLARIAEVTLGRSLTAAEIASGAADGDRDLDRVMDVWTDLACSLLQNIILTVDPDCIVIGGGVSNIAGIDTRLAARLPDNMLRGVSPPPIRLAQGGDSSGTRGAALMALALADEASHD
jgi:predicted NBD/HSP70 family sugar kinase